MEKEYKNYKNEQQNTIDNVIKKLKNIILSKFKENNISKDNKIVLYAIAPNSILVSIAYILKNMNMILLSCQNLRIQHLGDLKI